MTDWRVIKSEYLRGNTSYRKLAETYGVSFSTLRKIAAKENWTDLRNKAEAKRDTKIVESVASQEAKRVEGIQIAADLLLQRITEGIKDGTLITDTQSIRHLTASIKDIREIKGMKSELDAQEQLARIEKLRKEAQSDDADKEIRVVIDSADLSEFSI